MAFRLPVIFSVERGREPRKTACQAIYLSFDFGGCLEDPEDTRTFLFVTPYIIEFESHFFLDFYL